MLIRACSFDIKKRFRFSVSCRFPITWIFNGTDREEGGRVRRPHFDTRALRFVSSIFVSAPKNPTKFSWILKKISRKIETDVDLWGLLTFKAPRLVVGSSTSHRENRHLFFFFLKNTKISARLVSTIFGPAENIKRRSIAFSATGTSERWAGTPRRVAATLPIRFFLRGAQNGRIWHPMPRWSLREKKSNARRQRTFFVECVSTCKQNENVARTRNKCVAMATVVKEFRPWKWVS